MTIIEDQYQKLISRFPNAVLVNNLIYHIKIPLVNDVFIDVNYKNYPKRPKVVLIKPDGQVYKKLDTMVHSLMSWRKNTAPLIVDLINEIVIFVEQMKSQEIMVKEELFEGVLALCRNQHPREILGLLRIDQGVVSEFILPPGATTNDSSGVFFPSRIPNDRTIDGTVHSHPTGNPYPSPADVDVFRKKRFNFIVGYPYNSLNCVRCFDQKGNELKFKLVP